MESMQPIALTSVIEEIEIRAVTFTFESGPVAGFEWRLEVTFPATADSPARREQLPWVFGSRQSVERMLATWARYIAGAGDPPKRSLQ